MSKFKVGDRVRVIGNKGRYSDSPMHHFPIGSIVTVTKVGRDASGWDCDPHDVGCEDADGRYQIMYDTHIVHMEGQKIVVTTDGVTTTARLFSGKDLVKSATAKCSPRDEFDFNIGAGIAVSRLLNTEEKKAEPQFNKADLVNGRFGCMSGGKWFVVVGDHFVYESGGFDIVSQVSADGSFERYSVDCIVEASSFNHARGAFRVDTLSPERIIWRRPGVKSD